MSLGDLWPGVFWIWFAISCVILLRRSLRKRAASDESADLSDMGEGSDLPAPEATNPPPRGSIFDPPPSPGSVGELRPIAEMVTGIELPCELAPVVEFVRRGGVHEAVAFVTRSYDAETVGRQVGEELRRLDFDLEAVDATEAIARRDADQLHLAVIADAGSTERDGRPAFPGAGNEAVVVELWTT